MSDNIELYWTYILCGLVLSFLITYLVSEWDSITYVVTEMFSDEFAGLPTSRTNINKIREILKAENIDTHKMTLIDFGCGRGDILDAFKDDFKRLIGIELNTKLARMSRHRYRNSKKIRIHNTDIMDYKFKKRPTILYAYEPLWQVNKDKADNIYRNVIDRLEKIECPTYVVYLTGIIRSDLTPILENSKFKQIYHTCLGIYNYRHLYIYKYQ